MYYYNYYILLYRNSNEILLLSFFKLHFKSNIELDGSMILIPLHFRSFMASTSQVVTVLSGNDRELRHLDYSSMFVQFEFLLLAWCEIY